MLACTKIQEYFSLQYNMNFPGHNYLGPGNPVLNGEPVDEDDRIAQIHDIAYDNATSDSDIRSADRQAIGAFSKDFVINSNYHSAIGAIGLGGKYLFESVFGVQYPRNVNKRIRGGEEQPSPEKGSIGGSPNKGDMSGSRTAVDSDEPSGKRQKKDGSDDMDISDSAKRESDSKSLHANANANGHGINIHHPLQTFKTGKLVFLHQRLLYSKGYQFKCIQNANLLQYTKNFLTTPLAQVPCHVIPWYMTQTEFDNLPVTSSVKICKTTVSPLGFRTPFQTNSSGTANVNSNLFVLGVHAHGLNNTLHGINMAYDAAVESPCVPTGVKFTNKDDWSHWWGSVSPKDDDIISFENIPCCYMNMHPLLNYFCHTYQPVKGNPTAPDLMKYVHIFNMENGMNNPTIQWQYKPQINVLKAQNPLLPASGVSTIVNFGVKPMGFQRGKTSQVNTTGSVTLQSFENTSLSSINVPYWSYIEQSGSRAHGFSEFGGGLQPPTLHVGVLPIHSYSTTPKDDDIQDITAIYKVDTYIEIEYSFDFSYPYSNFGNAHSLCTGDLAFITQDPKHNYAYGYKALISDSTSTTTT